MVPPGDRPLADPPDDHHEEPCDGPSRSAPDDVALALPADPVAPGVVRRRLRAWLDALAWPHDDRDDVVLAASEAVSNAVEHAYPDGAEGRIRIDARAVTSDGGRRVVVRVADDGRWRPVERFVRYRGHGFDVMRASMQSVEVLPGATGTTVILTSADVPS